MKKQMFFYSWKTAPQVSHVKQVEGSSIKSIAFDPPTEKSKLYIWRCESENVARRCIEIMAHGSESNLFSELVLMNSGLVGEEYLLDGVAEATAHIVTSDEVKRLRRMKDKDLAEAEFLTLGNGTFEAVIDFDKQSNEDVVTELVEKDVCYVHTYDDGDYINMYIRCANKKVARELGKYISTSDEYTRDGRYEGFYKVMSKQAAKKALDENVKDEKDYDETAKDEELMCYEFMKMMATEITVDTTFMGGAFDDKAAYVGNIETGA